MSEAYQAFAYAYDQSLGRDFFQRIAPRLDDLIARHDLPGRTHLDLACGTGLALAHFQSRGFRSLGLDASLSMLGIARGRAANLVAGDMRDLPLRGRFALVTSLYDSLNHLLSRSQLARAFRAVHSVMSGDGLFVFDMNQPAAYRTVWSETEPFLSRGRDYELEIHTSYSRLLRLGVGQVKGWAIVNDKRVKIDEVRKQRPYSRDTILRLLDEAALIPVEILAFDPFPETSAAPREKAKWIFAVRREKGRA